MGIEETEIDISAAITCSVRIEILLLVSESLAGAN